MSSKQSPIETGSRSRPRYGNCSEPSVNVRWVEISPIACRLTKTWRGCRDQAPRLPVRSGDIAETGENVGAVSLAQIRSILSDLLDLP
jgi:hypothetical protein